MNIVSRIDNSKVPALITPWSIIHLIVGIVAGYLVRTMHLDFTWSLIFFIVCHTIYEIKDAFITNGKNSVVNSIGDELIAILGFMYATHTSLHSIPLLVFALYILFASPLSAEDGKTWSFSFDSWYTRG